MKNSTTIKKMAVILTLITISASFGQDKPTTTTTTTTTTTVSTETNKPTIFTKKQELKLDLVKALFVPGFEVSYELIQSKDFSYGCNMFVSLAKADSYYESFSLTPFARFYFQETKEYGAKGFFVEGFGSYANVNYEGKSAISSGGSYYSYTTVKNYGQIALGFSLGKKWVNNSGFVFEILGGLGRPLNAPTDAPTVMGRFDLSAGYRF